MRFEGLVGAVLRYGRLSLIKEPQKMSHPNPNAWKFDNTYARLPGEFFALQKPEPVEKSAWVVFNRPLAIELGLDAEALSGDSSAEIFAGNRLPEGSEPIAQAYAGHQFGHFTMLGDGRAILLGEHLAPGGRRFDIQLKGSGPTPFSRRGDGRAALGPMLREYIISEALHALGIPTTRSLAVVSTGEIVYRQTPLPGAVLTRVAASHIRVGTFEYAAARRDEALLKALADYTIARHYPELAGSEHPYLALLDAVIERQAVLIAQWQLVGFVHGVMNTDNMAISGETIDYGPCAFLDGYHPDTVFSSIDQAGRYAFGNQPKIAKWNLARFAETLLPLIHEVETQAIELAGARLEGFTKKHHQFWLTGMRAKLGLFTEAEGDAGLAESLLKCMSDVRADYTNTFLALSEEGPGTLEPGLSEWKQTWQSRLSEQPQNWKEVQEQMRRNNPAVIPRNHKVEEALEAAQNTGDITVLERLMQAIEKPFERRDGLDAYQQPSKESGAYQTFCGT